MLRWKWHIVPVILGSGLLGLIYTLAGFPLKNWTVSTVGFLPKSYAGGFRRAHSAS